MPIASSSGGTPPPTSPLTQPKLEKPAVNPADLCAGCIVWLPRRSNCLPTTIRCARTPNCCGNQELDNRGYNHPVIVLQIRQREGSNILGDLECILAGITSFGGLDIETHIQHQHFGTRPDIHLSIPIRHQNTASLALEAGKTLQKQSYILYQHLYTVPVALLRTFSVHYRRAYKLRLEENSYKGLMEGLGLEPDVFFPTNRLWETAQSRLEILRRSTDTALVSKDFAFDVQSVLDFQRVYQENISRLALTTQLVHSPSATVGYGAVPVSTYGYYGVAQQTISNGDSDDEPEEVPSFVKLLLVVAMAGVIVGGIVWVRG